MSSVFKWCSEDFNEDIVWYFIKYARGDLKTRLQKQAKEIRVEYLDDDWSLNGK